MAESNVARAVGPADGPELAEFVPEQLARASMIGVSQRHPSATHERGRVASVQLERQVEAGVGPVVVALMPEQQRRLRER